MWSIDYVQVPDENSSAETEKHPSKDTHQRPTPIHHRLVKQINVSNDSAGSLMKSGSESSLSEDNSLAKDKHKLEGSTKEWRNEQQNEKEVCSDTEEAPTPPPTAVRRRRSRVHAGLRKSEGGWRI